MNLDIHTLADIANILNRMKDRIKVFRKTLPDGFINAEILDINELQAIFNNTFAKENEKNVGRNI